MASRHSTRMSKRPDLDSRRPPSKRLRQAEEKKLQLQHEQATQHAFIASCYTNPVHTMSQLVATSSSGSLGNCQMPGQHLPTESSAILQNNVNNSQELPAEPSAILRNNVNKNQTLPDPKFSRLPLTMRAQWFDSARQLAPNSQTSSQLSRTNVAQTKFFADLTTLQKQDDVRSFDWRGSGIWCKVF